MQVIKTPLDRPSNKRDNVFFLGAWCFKELDGLLKNDDINKTLPYHWDNRDKYNEDYDYLTLTYEKLLKRFSKLLNKFHNINKRDEYWRIIFGPWLRFFIDIVFDRYECIRLSRNHSKNITYSVSKYDIKNFCQHNFEEFYSEIVTDEWNEMIFSECIKFLNYPHTQNNQLELKPKINNFKNSRIQNFNKKSLETFNFFYRKYFKKNNVKTLISGSYFPYKSLIYFHFKLGQLPFPFKRDYLSSNGYIDSLTRNNLTEVDRKKNFENFILYLVPKLMPRIYLEDFKKSKDYILKEFPVTPKMIFTSVNYQAKDYFKILCAEMNDLGSKLIIGQHGGHFGLGRHNQTIDHQRSIAFKFISWGWKSKNHSQVIDLPSVQLSSKNFGSKKNGYILHITSSLPRYFYCNYSVPIAGQYLSYINDQVLFLRNLNKPTFNRLKIRLDSSFKSESWDLGKIFSFYGYSKYIDATKRPLQSLLKKSCLSICTHNGTVYLETLSNNFPTIIFWDKRYNEIKPESEKYIQSLVDAGILFFSPIEAAKQVNKIIYDLDSWWYSKDLQLTIKDFCQNFARTSNDWDDKWCNFFNKL